jgi:hypothetical protein
MASEPNERDRFLQTRAIDWLIVWMLMALIVLVLGGF